MKHRLIASTACLLLAASFAFAQQAQAPAKLAYPGDPVEGKRLVATVGCWECHGNLGQGGVGPRLAPNPLPLTAFVAYVRSPKGEMPPFPASILSAKNLVDIHAYFESIPKPPVVPAGSLPP